MFTWGFERVRQWWPLLGNRLRESEQANAELSERLARAEADSRELHERLHEVRATIAGISCASEMIGDTRVPEQTRSKLQGDVTSEVARLTRLLERPDGRRRAEEPMAVDLDTTIDAILSLHRARGRVIDWETSGAVVQGRKDDITEAINILLDNAAKHGGDGASRIRVTPGPTDVTIQVSDSGPGVPVEMRRGMFEWGVRGGSSGGQGIGLNLGRRLIAQQGGDLRLVDPAPAAGPGSTPGATFAITLPAARTSVE